MFEWMDELIDQWIREETRVARQKVGRISNSLPEMCRESHMPRNCQSDIPYFVENQSNLRQFGRTNPKPSLVFRNISVSLVTTGVFT